jgi:hypothetical protein
VNEKHRQAPLVERRHQPLLPPNLAAVRLRPHLAGFGDSRVVVGGFDPIRQANMAATFDVVEPVVRHPQHPAMRRAICAFIGVAENT